MIKFCEYTPFVLNPHRMKSNARTSLQSKFYSGLYKDVVSDAFESSSKLNHSDLAILIAALAFTGDLLGAESLFKSSREKLTGDDLGLVFFFLSIGQTRRSKYSLARIYMDELKTLAKESAGLSYFYSSQAEAFFLYFRGQFEECKLHAEDAFAYALNLGNSFAIFLATDLLGHTLVQTGSIHSGIKRLEDALTIAKKLKNLGSVKMIRSSVLQYQCEFGLTPKTALKDLFEAIQEETFQDGYSQANLRLELARQQTLRGQFQEARIELERVGPTIFANENRRQEITLNLRLAEIEFLSGNLFAAQHFTRSAKRCLEHETDSTYALRVFGMEKKLLRHRGESTQAVDNEASALLKRFSFHVNSRINTRASFNAESRGTPDRSDLRFSEDALGNLLDEVSTSDEQTAMKLIFQSGYFSLLKKLKLFSGFAAIVYLDLSDNSVTMLGPMGVTHKENVLTGNSRRLLLALKQRQSKEELVQKVWGYTYDPLRHDSILHMALSSLRKTLGPFAEYLKSEDGTYYLSLHIAQAKVASLEDMNLQLLNVPNADVPTQTPASNRLSELQRLLNLRQVKALKYLQGHEALDVTQYQKILRTTRITACRDLAQLVEQNLLERRGRARATKYVLKSMDFNLFKEGL